MSATLSLHDEENWPGWVSVALGIGPLIVAVATFVAGDVERPWVLALLLAVAVAPWIVEMVRGCPLDWPKFYVTAAALAAQHLLGGPLGISDDSGTLQTSLLILCFAVGETAAIRTTAHAAAVTAIGVAVAVGSGVVDTSYDAVPIWTVGMFIGLFCGLLIRRLVLALEEVKAAQAALEADAAVRERQRIAREVHDVIAHSMTVTMLHITAARMAVARGDADGATEALEEAERQGRRSLADIRGTVGLLRTGGAEATAAPVAADLGELVAGYRSAGLHVDASMDRLDEVPAPVGLAVHRIVQESLANVAKHAPGAAATLSVDVDDAAVEVVVGDDGVGARPAAGPPGHGLLGMRERAESLGGTFEAGSNGRGWKVRATIPVAQA